MRKQTTFRCSLIFLFSLATSICFAQESVPGEFLVQLKHGRKASNVRTGTLQFNSSYVKRVIPEENIVVVKRPMFEMADKSIELLKNDSDVSAVEPNYIYHALNFPNDPLMDGLWGFKNTGQKDNDGQAGKPGVDIDVERAWDLTTGNRDVVIAIIDTGVNYNYPDLKDNIWVNSAEAVGQSGVDDDNNGIIDDIHGARFTSQDPITTSGDPLDDHGHGTHCAGTIGAVGNNADGVAGINWKVRIMPVKFLNKNGSGNLDDAILAINYATKMGAQIMSNSWGGGGYSDLLKTAIERARDAGILFVAAAGNDGSNNDTTPTYPASYPVDNIVSVAAIDNRGKLASFSNYGSTVHIGAPGVNILSITKSPTGDWAPDVMSGTSMATPHVAGVAALLKGYEPTLSVSELKTRLIENARPLAGLRGKISTGGIVDAYAVLKNEKPAPDLEDPFYWKQQDQTISTDHPYKDSSKLEWTIDIPGAAEVAIYFAKFKTERGFDNVSLYAENGDLIQTISGEFDETYSDPIPGHKVRIVLTSDKSVTDYGFDVTRVAYKEAQQIQ